LIGLQAKTARVLRDGKEVDLPVEEVLAETRAQIVGCPLQPSRADMLSIAIDVV
jgi:hypothetical protein